MTRQTKLLIALAVAAALFLVSRTRMGSTVIGSAADKLAALLSGEEGERLTAYQDIAGKWTIGKGHLIRPGERFHPYGPVKTITREESAALFAADTRAATNAVAAAIKVPATENQRTAMASLAFNIGGPAFAGSTLVKKFNAGDRIGAADEFPKWKFVTDPKSGVKIASGSLASRRARERALFLTA